MDLNLLLREDFIVVAGFLSAIGAILKYRTVVPTKLVPLILFAIAFVVCSVWGYFTSQMMGIGRWVDAVLMCGLVNGLVASSLATWAWDAFYGVYRFRHDRKKGGNE